MTQENQSDKLTRLEQKIASNLDNVKDIHALADTYADLEIWEKAIEAYKTAISLEPNNAELYNSLGTIYEEVDQLEDAEQAYQQAIALDPKISAAYYNLGCLYEDQQRLPEAIQAYKKYLQYVNNAEELVIIKQNLKEVGRIRIRKVGWLSLAKILGVMYAIVGLILGVIFTVIALFLGFPIISGPSFFDFSSIILAPLGYGVVGVITGLIVAVVYNLIAGWLGGIELETEK